MEKLNLDMARYFSATGNLPKTLERAEKVLKKNEIENVIIYIRTLPK